MPSETAEKRTLDDGKWHHTAVTVISGNCITYIDGVISNSEEALQLLMFDESNLEVANERIL